MMEMESDLVTTLLIIPQKKYRWSRWVLLVPDKISSVKKLQTRKKGDHYFSLFFLFPDAVREHNIVVRSVSFSPSKASIFLLIHEQIAVSFFLDWETMLSQRQIGSLSA